MSGGTSFWRWRLCAGVSPVRVSIVTGRPISPTGFVEVALDVDGQRLERRDVERVDAAPAPRPACASAAPARSVSVGRKPASVLPAPVGAISSTDLPACAFASSSIWWARGDQPRSPNHFMNWSGRMRWRRLGIGLWPALSRHTPEVARAPPAAKRILEQTMIRRSLSFATPRPAGRGRRSFPCSRAGRHRAPEAGRRRKRLGQRDPVASPAARSDRDGCGS